MTETKEPSTEDLAAALESLPRAQFTDNPNYTLLHDAQRWLIIERLRKLAAMENDRTHVLVDVNEIAICTKCHKSVIPKVPYT
jgi:hypothetical protein